MKIYDPFKYKGEVKVKLIIKDKVLEFSGHNDGTLFLQKAFSKFLTDNISSSDLPALLDLRINSSTLLIQSVPLSGRQYQFDDQYNRWQALFTAVVSYDNLLSTQEITQNPKLYLTTAYNSLDSTSSSQDLASIEIDKDIVNSIQPGIQILIQWYMYLNI